MKLIPTALSEVKLIEPQVFGDERGYFFESFNQNRYKELLGIEHPFVQDNESLSLKSVLRGLHFQNPKAQGKLVSVREGRIFDVAVDIRRDSPNFSKWVGVELSSDNKRQLWIPRGFAHGFLVLSEKAIFSYKCDEYYSPESEFSILWNDPEVNIDWPDLDPILSEKDSKAFRLAEIPREKLPCV